MGTEGLEAFMGEWSLEVSMPVAPAGDIGARATSEWMPGGDWEKDFDLDYRRLS